mmetsp:Transcript_1815/g.6643  ORF Transcript_1815/g.6643 Transcript_1815/m.6643 type:complete len:387 (-) Transcript_1815:2322-3482(-)
MDMAERSESAEWMFCRLQCVKYAASSAVRTGSSLNSLRLISIRSARAYSRTMLRSSLASSTSLRVSTTRSGMAWSMAVNWRSASVNLPSVVVLYALRSASSSCGRVVSGAGGRGAPPAGLSALHPRPRIASSGGVPASATYGACDASAPSRKACRSGSRLQSPIWRVRRRAAVSKEPAATCSPASDERCVQRCAGGGPEVGATNPSIPASGKPPSISGGSSRSSISQPPSPSSSSSPSPPIPSPSGKPPAPPSSSPMPGKPSRSSPHPPPAAASSSASSAMPPAPMLAAPSPSSPAPPAASPANAPSKSPLLTVRSGQLSSFRIGAVGSMSAAAADTSGSAAPPSVSVAAMRSASSAKPCVAAVTYASERCPTSSRMRTRSRTSPR